MKIKNIFWDVDGVLADINYAYYNFLKNYPTYAPQYKNLRWQDLDKVLPINPIYGALDLKCHPTLGEQMDYDFCHHPEFFENRPLYPKVIETLRSINQKGYRQFTLSASFDAEVKKKFLTKLLAPVTDFLTIECVGHGQFLHDTTKEGKFLECFKKYGITPEETILVDDRIYNMHAALNVGVLPVRMRCDFTSALPQDLSWIQEVRNVEEVEKWLDDCGYLRLCRPSAQTTKMKSPTNE